MNKLVILICVVIGVVICKIYKKRQKRLADYEMIQNKERIKTIQHELEYAGYNISNLIDHDGKPESIENAIKKNIESVPLYDRNSDCYTSIDEVYKSLCKLQRDTLIFLSDEKLADLLMIPIKYIPLNQNVAPTEVRARVLKRLREKGASKESMQYNATRVFMNFEFKSEAIRQRKELMVQRILNNLGLSYPEALKSELPSNENYITAFNDCFEKQEKICTLMEEAGYHLGIALINKVAFVFFGSTNSVHVNTPVEELYDWLCKVRTAELSEMIRFDETNFDKLLGCPLDEIPSPKGSDDLRAICAVQCCLLKEGLTINIKSLATPFYYCEDKKTLTIIKMILIIL